MLWSNSDLSKIRHPASIPIIIKTSCSSIVTKAALPLSEIALLRMPSVVCLLTMAFTSSNACGCSGALKHFCCQNKNKISVSGKVFFQQWPMLSLLVSNLWNHGLATATETKYNSFMTLVQTMTFQPPSNIYSTYSFCVYKALHYCEIR